VLFFDVSHPVSFTHAGLPLPAAVSHLHGGAWVCL
jgi:hypothetical protein